MKKWIALFLAAVLLAGCGPAGEGKELRETVSSGEAVAAELPDEGRLMDFSLGLLKYSCDASQNVTISPVSVLSALAMTASGAEGETREEISQVMGAAPEELAGWLRDWQGREGVILANSIWFRDDPDLTVRESFLQTCRDEFSAGAYRSSFDQAAVEEINNWVSDNTGGMIDGILNQIPEDAMVYLVSALTFEAQWAQPYTRDSVREGFFYPGDGTERLVKFMHSEEDAYLEGEGFTGFLRRYSGERYIFAALLPEENTTVEELLTSLDGDSLLDFIEHPSNTPIQAALPKFEMEYSAELSGVLKAMGMEAAFDSSRADFTSMATCRNNLFVGKVLHKNFLSVAESGTRGGAATAIEVVEECIPEEVRTIRLDRPFVYLILDQKTGFPVFLGTMMDPGQSSVTGDPMGVAEHSHCPAGEDQTVPHEVLGYCGNILTTVNYDGKESTFMGSDSVYLTDLLTHLDYDPEKLCKCLPEITVTLESGAQYGISLSGYARSETGQAELTEEQLQKVMDIIDNME